MTDGGGNLLVIAAELDGAVVEFWKADHDRPVVADSVSRWFSELLIEFDSQPWIEFRGAYVRESDVSSLMAWDKVDVVLERMPEKRTSIAQVDQGEIAARFGDWKAVYRCQSVSQ